MTTIDTRAQGLVCRDYADHRFIHVYVSVFTSNPFQYDLSPIQTDEIENLEFYPVIKQQNIVALAHFFILRTNLTTSFKEFSDAISENLEIFKKQSSRAYIAASFATNKNHRRIIETAMLAADDRWVEQAGVLLDFHFSPSLSPYDLYGACLKELLYYTNPLSGIVVIGKLEEPSSKDISACNYINEIDDIETDDRIVLKVVKEDTCPSPFIISGIAQRDARIDPNTSIAII